MAKQANCMQNFTQQRDAKSFFACSRFAARDRTGFSFRCKNFTKSNCVRATMWI